MPESGNDLFQIPPHLDPSQATDRAEIVILTSATLAQLLADHLCQAFPPDRTQLDADTAKSLIAAQIRTFVIFYAIERYRQAGHSDSWAASVGKQIESDYPKAWQRDLQPFTNSLDENNADEAARIRAKLKDPFAPYRGSVLDATESNLPESAFGRLLRVVIPALYLEATQQAAGRRLLDLAARGTRAFLADVCNA